MKKLLLILLLILPACVNKDVKVTNHGSGDIIINYTGPKVDANAKVSPL